MTNEEWINMFINKFNENKDYKITDVRDREKLLDELRPQGEWIFNRKNPQTGANIFRCSLCNYESQVFTCGIKYPAFDKFCGGCGAKMKGGEEE